MSDDNLLTTGEAAHLIKRSTQMVRLYERSGRLKAAVKTVGGMRLFRLSDVRDLGVQLEKQSVSHESEGNRA